MTPFLRHGRIIIIIVALKLNCSCMYVCIMGYTQCLSWFSCPQNIEDKEMQDASTAIHTVHVSHGCMWATGHDTLNDNYVYECQEGVAVQAYVCSHFLNAIIILYSRYFSRGEI